jgi:hypothetical protein
MLLRIEPDCFSVTHTGRMDAVRRLWQNASAICKIDAAADMNIA